jgi:hypothetical protein
MSFRLKSKLQHKQNNLTTFKFPNSKHSMALLNYLFEVSYIPAVENVMTDCLSRKQIWNEMDVTMYAHYFSILGLYSQVLWLQQSDCY